MQKKIKIEKEKKIQKRKGSTCTRTDEQIVDEERLGKQWQEKAKCGGKGNVDWSSPSR